MDSTQNSSDNGHFFGNCLRSLSQTPYKLRKRMLATWTPDQELNQVRLRSGADMKRKLYGFDLVALGVGGMLGVGVFVTTGPVARTISGPAVVVSYIIAAISALLSSMCYTEFSIAVPVAGGAFSYLRVTFGEFLGYFAGANILMEYVLSNAAVARSFTEYFSGAFGVENPNSWRVEVHGFVQGMIIKVAYNQFHYRSWKQPLWLCNVNTLAALTIPYPPYVGPLEALGTKESSILNLLMTIFHIIFFGFIIIAGFWNGNAKNLVSAPGGFAPFGVKGVVDGAAIVYFSYIGYDSVSTLAEEIKNPSKNLPVGIVGSVIVVSALYCLMAVALCFMVPYNEISDKASFAMAFQKIGWKWASHLVGVGASLGIVASLLVAMLGQARYLCVIARARLVPAWLAKVHPSTGTPMNATLFLGLCTASIALFTELDIVLEIISIGTLLVFYLVANALIYRRYVIMSTCNNPPLHTLLFLFLLTATSLGFSLSWKLERRWWGLSGVFGASWITITAVFHFMMPSSSSQQQPQLDWSVPLMPWPAALSVFLNVFLMTTLKIMSFQRFGIWTCLTVLFYVLYGVHSTYRVEMETVGENGVSSNNLELSQESKIDIQQH